MAEILYFHVGFSQTNGIGVVHNDEKRWTNRAYPQRHEMLHKQWKAVASQLFLKKEHFQYCQQGRGGFVDDAQKSEGRGARTGSFCCGTKGVNVQFTMIIPQRAVLLEGFT